MKQAVLVFAIALVITLAIGPAVINYLRKMKFGQKILEIGPKWHMNKQNIPTMGGFMFIIGIAAAVIIGNIVMGEISVSSLAVLGLAVAYGTVGLVDDYAKIKKKENAGLTPKQKLVLQILVAGVFILVLFLGSTVCRSCGFRSRAFRSAGRGRCISCSRPLLSSARTTPSI